MECLVRDQASLEMTLGINIYVLFRAYLIFSLYISCKGNVRERQEYVVYITDVFWGI